MRVRLGCAVALVAAGLAGCSSTSERPRGLPTLAPPSPSSTAPLPPTPAGYSPATPEGAAASARAYYKTIEQAFDAKDPRPIEALSSPDCRTCNDYIASVKGLRDSHERLDGHLRFAIKLAEAPAITGPTVRVDVIWSTPALKRYDAKGKLVLDQKALVDVQEELLLGRRGKTWIVHQFAA